MARREKVDRGLASRLDEFEKRMFVLKIEYEKHFSGLEQVEPMRERESLRRLLRELMTEYITNTRQKHRVRSMRARWSSMELYWTRNLVMIERGTHPKMKFRANQTAARTPAAVADRPTRRAAPTTAEREAQAYQAVFDKYLETRKKCGQSSDMAYESVRDVLKKQVRTIKSRYRCKSVKFRVTVEDGKAKVKAVPLR